MGSVTSSSGAAAAPLAPFTAPLTMPIQRLDRSPRPTTKETKRVKRSRVIILALTLLLVLTGMVLLIRALAPGGLAFVELVSLILFIGIFTPVALTTAKVVTFRCVRHGPVAQTKSQAWQAHGTENRTALLLPVYHEDPAEWAGRLEAMLEDLTRTDPAHGFEAFILSDSRDADLIAQEEAIVHALRGRMQALNTQGPALAIWYRHRADNKGRKAGNIADWVRRWGARYEHMIVLDADSIMSADTLLGLRQRMAADPQAGIIQTVPLLVGADTLFGKLQQFANRVYGPLMATAHGFWQQEDGNYWGHNAIIRTRAFAETCGLPELPGPTPFGGDVLSHDFVEAAFMRRAGWRVSLVSDLQGSFEGAPPSLPDAAKRDRRWAQGNLQHSKLLSSKGLHWMSRVHMVDGIMSYATAPLWVAFVLSGFLLTGDANSVTGLFIGAAYAGEPVSARIETASALAAFLFSMVVLMVPRFLALAEIHQRTNQVSAYGGRTRLSISFLIEFIVSTLLAPIMMLVHSQNIFDILRGRDTGWSAQSRHGQGISLLEAIRFHRYHLLIGLGLWAIVLLATPGLMWWVLPALLGLSLAPVLSWFSSHPRVNQWLDRWGLLQTRLPSAYEALIDRASVLAEPYRPVAAAGARASEGAKQAA